MKYIKISLIGIAIFASVSFYNISPVKAACLPGDPGYPNCNTVKPTPSTKPSNYPSDASGCSNYCTNKLPSSPGQQSSCISDCQGSFKPVESYETCVSKCNNTSSADKSSCINACSVTAEKPVTTPEVKPEPTPTLNLDGEADFYKPLSSGDYVCGGMMSTALRDELVKIYKTISLVMVVAVIIFGMLDFFKVVSSGDADTMKKMTKKFTNRLIIVILIAILPVVLQFILTLFGNESMKTCLNYF